MTTGLIAMLAGLFIVPAVLLWAGHRMRRRSPRWHSAFWGAIIAHVVIAPMVMVAAMWPASDWDAGDTWRGFFGFWAMLVAPIVGAMIGVLLRRNGTRSGR